METFPNGDSLLFLEPDLKEKNAVGRDGNQGVVWYNNVWNDQRTQISFDAEGINSVDKRNSIHIIL